MSSESRKRALSECNWVEKVSSKYSKVYWFNTLTGKSVWEDPLPNIQAKGVVEKSSNHSSLIRLLQEEHAGNDVPEKFTMSNERCPRLISGLDILALVVRLRNESAYEVKDNIPRGDFPDFRIVFGLPNDDTALITRAIQEDEILKTRLKVYDSKGNGAVDLPSFWEVWNRPDRKLATEILNSSDPNEMKWTRQREQSINGKGKFQYKLATTFMPAFAKQIYTYFEAKKVLDPCAGWGDRLLGAACTSNAMTTVTSDEYKGVERYVAFDPNRNLRMGYTKILEACGAQLTSYSHDTLTFSNGFEINSLPFEKGSLKLEADSFDLVFTSPPFFDYEMYNPLNPQYSSWIEDFYVPLMQQSCRCVRPGRFVCIHIGDTTAGEIVPFLKERVQTICPLKLVFRIGLQGVKSNQIRDVWVFQKALPVTIPPSLPPQPLSQALKEHVKKVTNPAVAVSTVQNPSNQQNYILFDDGAVCVGGSKQRFLGRLLCDEFPPTVEEFVYAGPDCGFAQVALAYTALLVGKKAVVFLNTARNLQAAPPPLVAMAMQLQGVIHVSPTESHRSLHDTELAAAQYVAKDPVRRVMMPFGLKFDSQHAYFKMFKEAIVEALPEKYRPTTAPGGLGIQPKRLWVVAGSGFIFSILHSIWPLTQLQVVQVGKTIWPDQMPTGNNSQLFKAPQKFAETSPQQPPYNSVPWYDAKVWQFIQTHGEEGDAIWNVAAVPLDMKKAVADAKRTRFVVRE
mmetsp:Transcript_420/g.676  ORF Transcript_420/g.676 Transcript_420/m.676 type:complete len:737 (+) Transcript_420:51-2261(+)